MSKSSWKNFHLWFCNLKCIPAIEDLPFNPSSSSPFSSSTAIATSDETLSSEQALPDISYRRFFFSSPGRSNSILDSPDLRSPSDHHLSLAGSIEVTKFSSDPYVDFRSSMQEMIDSRKVFDVRIDWSYLHNLLLCYLHINPKPTHKFIIRAFSDVLVSHLASASASVSTHNRRNQEVNCQQFDTSISY